jgi:hypothetical protein
MTCFFVGRYRCIECLWPHSKVIVDLNASEILLTDTQETDSLWDRQMNLF